MAEVPLRDSGTPVGQGFSGTDALAFPDADPADGLPSPETSDEVLLTFGLVVCLSGQGLSIGLVEAAVGP